MLQRGEITDSMSVIALLHEAVRRSRRDASVPEANADRDVRQVNRADSFQGSETQTDVSTRFEVEPRTARVGKYLPGQAVGLLASWAWVPM